MEPSESPQVVKGILRKPGEKREYKGEMSMATQDGDDERVRDEAKRLYLKRRETGYFPPRAEPERTENDENDNPPAPIPEPARGILRKPGEKREPKGVMTVAEAEGDEDRVRTAERKAKLARRDTAYFPPMDVPDEEENPTPPASAPTSPTTSRERDPKRVPRTINKNPYNKGAIVSASIPQAQRATIGRVPPPKPAIPCPVEPPPKPLQRLQESKTRNARTQSLLLIRLDSNISPIQQFSVPFKTPNLDPNIVETWFISFAGAYRKHSLVSDFQDIGTLIKYETPFELGLLQVQDLTNRIFPLSTPLGDLGSNVLLVFDLENPPTEKVYCAVRRSCRGSKVVLVSPLDKASRGFAQIFRNGNQSETVYLCELHHQILKNEGCSVNNEACSIGGPLRQPKNRSFTINLFGLDSNNFVNTQLLLCDTHYIHWVQVFNSQNPSDIQPLLPTTPTEGSPPQTSVRCTMSETRRSALGSNISPRLLPAALQPPVAYSGMPAPPSTPSPSTLPAVLTIPTNPTKPATALGTPPIPARLSPRLFYQQDRPAGT